MFTMFVATDDQKDKAKDYICIGDQNHGTAFTILAGNPHLTIYGWEVKAKWWVEFNPLDCPAVEDGELYPMAVLGAGPEGKADKPRIAMLNGLLKDYKASRGL